MKIPQGILAGGGGKVGPVVGSRWRGIDYVRAHIADIANPRTEGQVRARAIITAVGDMINKANNDFIRPYLRPFRQDGQTEQNLFSRRNINALRGLTWNVGPNATAAEEAPDFRDVVVFGEGELETAPLNDVTYDSVSGIVSVEWNNTVSGNGLASDKVIVIAMIPPSIRDLAVGQTSYKSEPGVMWVDDSATRNDSTHMLTAYTGLTASDLFVYLVLFREGENPLISNTVRSVATAS